MTFAFYGAMFVVRALTKPVFGIGLTLFYFDQRIRKEGFDIEWMMQQAGMVEALRPSATDVGSTDSVSMSAPIMGSEAANLIVGAHRVEAMESLVLQPPTLRNSPQRVIHE